MSTTKTERPEPDRFSPPGAAEFMAAEALVAPWRALTDPRFDGYQHLPKDGRYMLVANHTTLGLVDIPMLVLDIHRRTGSLVRSLGERQHFRVPMWRTLLTRFGTINGSRANTRMLLESSQPVLVFPGGGREVARKRDDHYPLVWRERIGFARLAIEYGYQVVPLSMVGVDDMWDVVIDSESTLYAPARALAERIGIDSEMLFPVVRGLGPTPLPRPQRIYGRIGPAIDAGAFGTNWEDERAARRLRDEIKRAVHAGIEQLRRERRDDPARDLLPRLRGELTRFGRAEAQAVRRMLRG